MTPPFPQTAQRGVQWQIPITLLYTAMGQQVYEHEGRCTMVVHPPLPCPPLFLSPSPLSCHVHGKGEVVVWYSMIVLLLMQWLCVVLSSNTHQLLQMHVYGDVPVVPLPLLLPLHVVHDMCSIILLPLLLYTTTPPYLVHDMVHYTTSTSYTCIDTT